MVHPSDGLLQHIKTHDVYTNCIISVGQSRIQII